MLMCCPDTLCCSSTIRFQPSLARGTQYDIQSYEMNSRLNAHFSQISSQGSSSLWNLWRAWDGWCAKECRDKGVCVSGVAVGVSVWCARCECVHKSCFHIYWQLALGFNHRCSLIKAPGTSFWFLSIELSFPHSKRVALLMSIAFQQIAIVFKHSQRYLQLIIPPSEAHLCLFAVSNW